MIMKQSIINQTTHRRGFLGTLAAGAAALGLSVLTRPLAVQAETFELDSTPAEAESWFDKIKGKHRMVFDATHPHEVFPFAWPKVFLMTNETTGSPSTDCTAVIVLRHSAIGYAFKDDLWAKYKLGEVFEANDHLTKAPALRNPFWFPKTGDFSVPGLGNMEIGINQLQEKGVMFCVCEVAMTVYASVVGEKMKMDPAVVRQEWVKGILPGIQPVPSGIWAVGRAQEHGCGYVFTG
jgi:intracellular sulfur oxidation DsrE/DsrF family protein